MKKQRESETFGSSNSIGALSHPMSAECGRTSSYSASATGSSRPDGDKTMAGKKTYSLPELPYAYNALHWSSVKE
jgi:hypothetical protein